jgi:putative transferase (TIGR04331 family)
MTSQHQIAPDIRFDYWKDRDSIELARACVERGAVEAIAILGEALSRRHGVAWTQQDWNAAIGQFVWCVTSFFFDESHCPSVSPDRKALSDFNWRYLVGFSCLDLYNGLICEESVREAAGRLVFSDAANAGTAVVDAMGALVVDEPVVHDVAPNSKTTGLRAVVRATLREKLHDNGSAEVGTHGLFGATARQLFAALASFGRIRPLAIPDKLSRISYRGPVRTMLLRDVEASIASKNVSALTKAVLPMICFTLPSAFMEQFEEARQWLRTNMRFKTRVLVTQAGLLSSPLFSIYAVERRRAGAKLVGVQHGGYYGECDQQWEERVERESSDVFCTWGWKNGPRDRPMPSLRLSNFAAPPDAPRFRPVRRILWSLSAQCRSVTLVAAYLSRRNYEDHARECVAAASTLVEKFGVAIAARPHPVNADAIVSIWREAGNGIEVESGNGRSLVRHAGRYDLVIFDSLGSTGFLECLVANIPALVFCPPQFSSPRPAAQKYYDLLRSAGIYSCTFGELCSSLEGILTDHLKWRSRPERIEAIRLFKGEFACASPFAMWTWARFLSNESGRS